MALLPVLLKALLFLLWSELGDVGGVAHLNREYWQMYSRATSQDHSNSNVNINNKKELGDVGYGADTLRS